MKPVLYGNRILILCDAVAERKVGSIIMPEKHSERSRTATVVAVGDTIRSKRMKWWHLRKKPIFGVGDRILISWYTGVHIHLIGEELFGVPVDEDRHRIVRDEEVLMKL